MASPRLLQREERHADAVRRICPQRIAATLRQAAGAVQQRAQCEPRARVGVVARGGRGAHARAGGAVAEPPEVLYSGKRQAGRPKRAGSRGCCHSSTHLLGFCSGGVMMSRRLLFFFRTGVMPYASEMFQSARPLRSFA